MTTMTTAATTKRRRHHRRSAQQDARHRRRRGILTTVAASAVGIFAVAAPTGTVATADAIDDASPTNAGLMSFQCSKPGGTGTFVAFTAIHQAKACFTAQHTHMHHIKLDWGDRSNLYYANVDAVEGDEICLPFSGDDDDGGGISTKTYFGEGSVVARAWINDILVYKGVVELFKDVDGCNVHDLYSIESLDKIASHVPTGTPSARPSNAPVTTQPTETPSARPSSAPVTTQPTALPTIAASSTPSATASASPSATASASPSNSPTSSPTPDPTMTPTGAPSIAPVTSPPTAMPTITASASPSSSPTPDPTMKPTAAPSMTISSLPSAIPTIPGTSPPTEIASDSPSSLPSNAPSVVASKSPSSSPTPAPTQHLSSRPSVGPSASPSVTESASPSSPPSTSKPTDRPSAKPVTSQPTAMPSVADIITDSVGCKDVDVSISCKAELLDGFVVDCGAVQFAEVKQDYLKITWEYRITNNCPHTRTLARQSMSGCSVCIPDGLDCKKTSVIFKPASPEDRKVTLAPGENAVETEEETLDLTKANTACLYSRDIVLRIKGGDASTGSFAADKKLTFVGPKK